MTTSRAKTADRQAALKKLLPLLKKHYKVQLPKTDQPVLETMLYAVCLEGVSVEEANRRIDRFHQAFPDLNEARVSQVSELECPFPGDPDADWRGYRLRAVLQFVFEKSFTFEFESLRKKTLDLAVKQLAKLKQVTPFVRNFTLQEAVGAHVVPIDAAMKNLLVWAGLAVPQQSEEDIGEGLKSAVRKADAVAFCAALRMAATDDRIQDVFEPAKHPAPAEGHDASDAIDRLQELLSHAATRAKPKAKSVKAKGEDAKEKPGAPLRKPVAVHKHEVKKAPAKKATKSAGRSKSG